MNNNLRKMFAIAAFCVVFGCTAIAFGQTRPLLGGYSAASVSSSDVKAAADFAIETKAAEMEQELTLGGIIKAEKQSVAGTNYRLCLQTLVPSENEDEDTITQYFKTVIYQDLKGNYKITSWVEEDCAEK